MCAGPELALIAAASAVASAGVGAYGAIQQAEAQAQASRNQAAAANYQSQLDERNAKIAEMNAQSAREVANVKEEAQRRRFNALEGQAMASIAQSGTGFDGSNLAMIEQNAINNELDALTIRYEGEQQAKGLGITADNYRSQSQLNKMNAAQLNANASAATTGGYLSAGSMLLSAPSKYYTTRYGIDTRKIG